MITKSINEQFKEFIEENMFLIYETVKVQNKRIFSHIEIFGNDDILEEKYILFMEKFDDKEVEWVDFKCKLDLPLFKIDFKSEGWYEKNIFITLKNGRERRKCSKKSK